MQTTTPTSRAEYPDFPKDDLLIPQAGRSLPADASSMTPTARELFCRQYILDRHKARTDLLWLCNNVLQYPDVCEEVHGPVIEHLQHFNGREEYIDPDTFEIKYSEPFCVFHPAVGPGKSCPTACVGRTIWSLAGVRFRMLLDPRGHLKTTVNTIAHSIQWILNFPDIRIALSVATLMTGSDIITEIENHFRYNERLRFLFPEYCPIGDRAGDWGSKEQFIIPNRRRKWLKEPTMRVVTIGKVVAGPHYDVIKHSDLVDKENVKTPGGIKDTKDHYKYMQPLLERGPAVKSPDGTFKRTAGWQDLEGTIYDFSDLYVEEMEKDAARAKAGRSPRWSVFRRDGVVGKFVHTKQKGPDGETVDTIRIVPFDDKEDIWKARCKCHPPFLTLWPARFPFEEFQAIYEDVGEYLFNCQYRLMPRSKGVGLCQQNELGFFPGKLRRQLASKMYVKVTIDLAGMEEDSEGCNNSVCVVGHNRDGRKYVLDALVGRPTALELVDYLFAIDIAYNKPIFQFEKAHHYDGLRPYIMLRSELKEQHLNIVAIPRDSSTSKDNRIYYTLQPLFKRRLIWIGDHIKALPHIVKEITQFPRFKFKDWLDTMADQMQTVDGKVDLRTAIPQSKELYNPTKSQGKFLGFDPVTRQPMWEGSDDGSREMIYGTDADHEDVTTRNLTGVL